LNLSAREIIDTRSEFDAVMTNISGLLFCTSVYAVIKCYTGCFSCERW